MDYNSATKQRFKELQSGPGGRLIADWQLTDSKLLDTVKVTMPPLHVIPIIFVPGIMGSNLADMNNDPVWLLDSIRSRPLKLAWNWAPRDAGERQSILHPARTKVFREGAVPKENLMQTLRKQDFLDRGWGEVSEASYRKFLLWLDEKMNASRDPSAWADFADPSEQKSEDPIAYLKKYIKPGIAMAMDKLPEQAEAGHKVDPILSDDLLARAKSTYPIYAFGYNWLDSNAAAALFLKDRIISVIKENNKSPFRCKQVILVTHSMGGLVARACSQLQGMAQKIVGVVHGGNASNRRCRRLPSMQGWNEG